MKSKVRILVNGVAATVLTGVVAGGLVLSSAAAFQTKNGEALSAQQLNAKEETVFQEEETEEDAQLLSPGHNQLGLLWDRELITAEDQLKENPSAQEDDEDSVCKEHSDKENPLALFFSDKAFVNPDLVATCLNVREEASEDAEIVDMLGTDEVVSVIGAEEEWTEIDADGIQGWVKTKYLLIGDAAADYIVQEGTPYARVDVSNMNIRLRPSTEADILDVAYEDDAYEVCLLEQEWVYAVYEGTIKGYLSADCVKLSYAAGDLWINTELSFTEETAGLLDIPFAESSSAALTQGSGSKNSQEYTALGGGEDTLLVLMPAAQPTESGLYFDTASQTAALSSAAAESVWQTTIEQDTSCAASGTEMASQTGAAAETQPSTQAVTMTGIEAFFNGPAKTEGDVVYRSEIYIVASFSDGNYATITDGWTSNDTGMILHAGDNTLTISYSGFSSVIVLPVAASATAPETQPTVPETTVPETTVPETTVPETTVPETSAAETQPSSGSGSASSGCIRVSNVSLSSELTQYTLNLCSQYGVDSSVIFSVMYHESRFNANATSGSGAQGLMQIIPRYSTARMAKLGVSNLYDPASNILVGVDILAEYYYSCGSWTQALTMYRTGNFGDSSYAAMVLGSIGMFQTVYYE